MSAVGFIHLAVKTAYSLSEGAIHIKELAAHLEKRFIPAVAISDTNNLFGGLEFSEIMKDAGVQPILGVTLSIDNPMLSATRSGRAPDPDIIRLYAQNDAGYLNLLKLVSSAHIDTYDSELPHVKMELLKECSSGLIALSGGPAGLIGHLLLDKRPDDASLMAVSLKTIFDDRFYLEIMRHGMDNEKNTEAQFLELAYRHNIPIVATNDAHFMNVDMYEAHDALLCIADGTYVAEGNRRKLTPEHRFKSPAEMKELFKDIPEAIENTVFIAKRCAVKTEKRDPILPNFAQGKDVSEADILAELSHKGLQQRLDKHVFCEHDDEAKRAELAEPYLKRLEFELSVIGEMGFPGYFLIVEDFIAWSKDNDVPVGPGRGSGAGSLVAWSLRITDLDPLRFGLLFERFLNPERISMPDFDIDFCQEKRDLVIHYVQEKYGTEQVAQIITFGQFQSRGAIRDVGRVLQGNYGAISRLADMVPNNPANPMTLTQAIAAEPRLREARDEDPLTAIILKYCIKLEGLKRHASTHAAGLVIGDRPLNQLVPLYRDPKSDMPVTQFNMKWVEKAGLVKFDFLGLKTLTVLAKTVEFIEESRGEHIDIEAMPLNDPNVFDLLSSGESGGVFQLESSGMRSVLKQLKPDKFEDIIALVALYRPGPMDNIPLFLNRKHGLVEMDYLHDWLKPVLEETYGVIVYQEQVMQIAQILAGYSLGEADLLRRAMGKKDKDEMAAQEVRFVDGAIEKGVDKAQAASIFKLVNKFAGYGFNKSHAAAYALVAYQTAYMKANYPVEFMAASMALDLQDTDKLSEFKKDIEQQGIELFTPDINKSHANFSVEKYKNGEDEEKLAVRYALSAIKNVGMKAMEGLVAEREENGPYTSLLNFAERLDQGLVNKRAMENLISAGAFDAIHENRAQAIASVEMLVKYSSLVAQEKASNQVSLFGEPSEGAHRPDLPEVRPWDEMKKLAQEQAALGFYISSHPLELFKDLLEPLGILSVNQVANSPRYIKKVVKIAGTVDSFQKRRAQKSGKPFAFLALSDATGSVEPMVFSDFIEKVEGILEMGGPVVVTLSVDKKDDDDSFRYTLRDIDNLEIMTARMGAHLSIEIEDDASLAELFTILDGQKGSKGQIHLKLKACEGSRDVNIALDGGYKITPILKDSVSALQGIGAIEMKIS
jgi:DNA polymerase-3 subunit alpha